VKAAEKQRLASSAPPDGQAATGSGRRHVRLRDFLPQVAKRSIAEFLDDHCAQYAASIAYHVLFSLFPLAIVLAGVFGIVVQATATQASVVDTIVGYVPLSASGDAQLRHLLEGATGNLSALGLLGIVGLVYAASGMMAAIRLALNEAWDVDEYRPFLRGKLVDLALVLGAAVLALVSFGLTVAVHVAGAGTSHLGFASGAAGWLLAIAVPLAMSFAVVLSLYRVVPAARVRLADAWPGAFVAACAFVLLENLFAVYLQHFANYNAVYGSLGAVVAFMFFVYLSTAVFLLGAEVASEWPRVRERLASGAVPQGPPLRTQLRGVVKGLWMR
jgi:membrane protein